MFKPLIRRLLETPKDLPTEPEEHEEQPMPVDQAFRMVLELAQENLIDEVDYREEHAEQVKALDTVIRYCNQNGIALW